MMRTSEERTQRILNKAKEQKKLQTKKRTRIISGISFIMAAVLALNLTLFVPYTVGGYDISAYKDSEYYELMQQIGELTYNPRTTNNFTEWSDAFRRSDFGYESVEDAAPPTSDSINSASGGQTYEEVTNNQVNGVIEGDLFKRSSDYIWYLSNKWSAFTLSTYTIAGEDSELISEYTIEPEDGTYFAHDRYTRNAEMYLSEDCKTVTVLAMCRTQSARVLYTEAINIDVSDPTSPKELSRSYVSGGYVSSRTVDGTLLLVTAFALGNRPDFSNPEAFLPQTGTRGNLKPLPMEDIVCPEEASFAKYTVVSSLDRETLSINDSIALFSYAQDVYVSENNLFVTRAYTREDEEAKLPDYFISTVNMTEITCIAYDETDLEVTGSVSVEGAIVNQYSMDERENVLRVFTTSWRDFRWKENYIGNVTEDVNISPDYGKDRCNLYCIDLDKFEIFASAESFAPLGEGVKSVRFDGEKAYVCTAEVSYHYDWNGTYWLYEPVITDPVFEFDLSDYSHITSKDTGTIPGYSLSLIKFTDDTLLGIGFGDSYDYLKVELYRANDSAVESVAAYERETRRFAEDFKAYFIDAEHGYVGLGFYVKESFTDYSPNGVRYVPYYLLLQFDGETLTEVLEVPLNGDFDDMRACYVDGYLYLFADNDFKVIVL